MEESSGEEFALPGKFVMLMLSPVPLRVHRMRPEQHKYTPGGKRGAEAWNSFCIRRGRNPLCGFPGPCSGYRATVLWSFSASC